MEISANDPVLFEKKDMRTQADIPSISQGRILGAVQSRVVLVACYIIVCANVGGGTWSSLIERHAE